MLKHKKQRDTLVVCLEGELDHHCAQTVRQELDQLIEDERVRNLVIDMQGLTFMDSSGIGVLIGRYRTISRRDGRMAVRNMSPRVERIFQLSGLQRIIEKVR